MTRVCRSHAERGRACPDAASWEPPMRGLDPPSACDAVDVHLAGQAGTVGPIARPAAT